MDLYERQLNFIETILEFHPEFLEVFAPDEKERFLKYFAPNWDDAGDYRKYHRFLVVSDPSIEADATALLRRFLAAHKIRGTDLLP